MRNKVQIAAFELPFPLSAFSFPLFLGLSRKTTQEKLRGKALRISFLYSTCSLSLSIARESESKWERERSEKDFKGMLWGDLWGIIYTFTWQKLKIRQVGWDENSLSVFSLSRKDLLLISLFLRASGLFYTHFYGKHSMYIILIWLWFTAC